MQDELFDELFFEGTKYVPLSAAAARSGLSRDHIGRLCRTHKIIGRRIGKVWFVTEDSLQSFISAHEDADMHRRENLSRERKSEYENLQKLSPLAAASIVAPAPAAARVVPQSVSPKETAIAEQLARAMNAPAGVSHAALALTTHVPLSTITPMMEVAHKLLAITLSLALVFSAYELLDPSSAHALFAGMQQGMRNDQHALADLYEGASHISLQGSLRGVARNGDGEFAAVSVASPLAVFASLGKDFSNIVASIISSMDPQGTDFAYLGISSQIAEASPPGSDAYWSIGNSAPASPAQASAVLSIRETGNEQARAVRSSYRPSAPAQIPTSNFTPPAQTTIIQKADLSDYVTQQSLVARLGDFESQLSRQFIGATLPASPAGTAGGFGNAFALSQNISNLSGVTIANPTITGTVSGITPASVPDLQSLNGLLGIGSGGTGTSTSPAANKLCTGPLSLNTNLV
jgi:hypothetical protein